MPIEFRCTSCGRLLRVTDEAAGQQAKCPECGKVMNVPTTSAPIAPGGGPAENPYQSPEYAGSAAAPPAEPTGEIFPALIDVGGVYSRTWTILKAHYGECLAGVFIIFVVAAIYGVASSLVFGSKPAGGMLMLQNIIGLVFNAWITAGAISCFLRIARGQASSLGELFNGGRYILPVIGANILVTLAVVFGLFLLIIPGIILALMFSQVNYLIVDRQASVFDAFGISRQCMASNKLTLFLIGLVGFFLSIPVAICTLFIGIPFLIAPFAVLMGAVVYLGVTGEWRSE